MRIGTIELRTKLPLGFQSVALGIATGGTIVYTGASRVMTGTVLHVICGNRHG